MIHVIDVMYRYRYGRTGSTSSTSSTGSVAAVEGFEFAGFKFDVFRAFC